MRRFEVSTPVKTTRAGYINVDDVKVMPTDEDVEDLNNGESINTLTTQGEEIILAPEAE